MNLDLLHRNRRAQRAFLGAILSVTCLGAAAVSFDCAKARSTSERLICSDPQLSALDDRLAALAAAGKKRAASPRAYQRALDAAWSERQKCQDSACVERWYARRIAALSAAEPEPDAPPARPLPKELPAPPAVPARPEAAAKPPAPAPVHPEAAAKPPEPASADGPIKPNVRPGSQLQVIGEELGFDIPLTEEDFMRRYGGSGGQCGVSPQLSGSKALSPSAASDCWTGNDCPAPAEGLRCKSVRIAFDGTGRIVLFTTTLATADGKRAEGARHLSKIVDRFAALGDGDVRSREGKNGRVLSSSANQGGFKLNAEVRADEDGKQAGTFSVATR